MTHVIKNVMGGMMVAGLLAGVCLIGAQSAEARSQAAIAGNPTRPSDTSCFQETFGGVRNVCGGWAGLTLPTVMDNNYGITVRVKAVGAVGTANIVQCQAWSVDGNGGSPRSSSVRVTARHDGATEELPLGISPHGFGGTYAMCWLQANTTVRSYHY